MHRILTAWALTALTFFLPAPSHAVPGTPAAPASGSPCAGAPSGEQALAADSSLDPTELERRGCFSDDSWPLPVRFSVEPPGSIPPRCAQNREAFQQGFREALSGQRFVNSMTVKVSPWYQELSGSPGRSPVRATRRACSSQRASGAGENIPLECCILGYRTGVPHLLKDILTQSRDRATEAGRRDQNCRNAFDKGMRDAQIACHATGASGCNAMSLQTIRYLGCYHLGFSYQASQCGNDLLRNGPSAYFSGAGIAIHVDGPNKSIDSPVGTYSPGILPRSGAAESLPGSGSGGSSGGH